MKNKFNAYSYLKMGDLPYIMIIFVYLFYFRLRAVPVVSSLESTTVLGGILLVLGFISARYRKFVYKEICKKKNLIIVIFCAALVFFAFGITFFNGESDASFATLLIHQLVYIVIGIFLYSYFKYKNVEDKIIEYIICAYFIQTFVQYLSFINPTFNTFTDMFKSEDIIILKKQYDGFRLNAISGGLAFNLAVGYGIVETVYIFRWNELKIKHKIICFIILLAGGLSAGRTSVFMLIIALCIYVFFHLLTTKSNLLLKKKTMISIMVLSVVVIILIKAAPAIISSLPSDFQDRLITVKTYLTKWVGVYFGGNSDTANNNFWKPVFEAFGEVKNVIFGDGLYTNADGSYYLHQDAGYIRAVAYGGIMWVTILFFYQLAYFRGSILRRKENIAIMLLILVCTLKADCLGVCIQTQLIITLLYLSNNDSSKENMRCYITEDCSIEKANSGVIDCI